MHHTSTHIHDTDMEVCAVSNFLKTVTMKKLHLKWTICNFIGCEVWHKVLLACSHVNSKYIKINWKRKKVKCWITSTDRQLGLVRTSLADLPVLHILKEIKITVVLVFFCVKNQRVLLRFSDVIIDCISQYLVGLLLNLVCIRPHVCQVQQQKINKCTKRYSSCISQVPKWVVWELFVYFRRVIAHSTLLIKCWTRLPCASRESAALIIIIIIIIIMIII